MITLNLKKINQGYYSNEFDNTKVTVSKFKSQWQLIVEDHTDLDKDPILLSEWFKTKKEAYAFCVNWLLTEFQPNA